MQGMTGANDKIRLIMSIVPAGYYLANSCNYIMPSKDYNLYALLAILNSKLVNWFFRCFSTNSNVNGYEVDNFPIVKLQEPESEELEFLVQQLMSAKDVNIRNALSHRIDKAVYRLYKLTDDEIRIGDPE